MQSGNGVPAARTGMSKCAFRGSDDATTFPFHVPANAMAVVELRNVASMIEDLGNKDDLPLASDMAELADEIDAGIEKFGKITHSITKEVVYAYEVDGFGNAIFMDDANIPSLLSLPYLGYLDASDDVYQATRRAVLARDSNPFYFSGSAGAGVGGPHQGYGMVRPERHNPPTHAHTCTYNFCGSTGLAHGHRGAGPDLHRPLRGPGVPRLARDRHRGLRLHARELQHGRRGDVHQAVVCVGQLALCGGRH
jgi:hypothetical protein